MKRLFTLLLAFTPFLLTAQILSFHPDTLVSGEAILDEYTAFQIDFENLTTDSLQLSWRLVENTFPEEWFIQLCDNGECYGTVPNNEPMLPIAAGATGFMKLDIHPEMVDGAGKMKFWIYETNGDPNEHDVITFQVFAGNPVSTIEPELPLLQVFPNPVDATLVLENDHAFPVQATLFSMEGRLIREQRLAEGTTTLFNVQDLPSGNYLLRLQSPAALEVRKISIAH